MTLFNRIVELDNRLGRGKWLPLRLAQMICDPDKDFIWRIEECDDGTIDCMYIGFCPIDSERLKTYATSEELPEWIKDRVAVLRMMPADPNDSVVFGVGRRVSESIYWVVE
jgi:hypothetical protein